MQTQLLTCLAWTTTPLSVCNLTTKEKLFMTTLRKNWQRKLLATAAATALALNAGVVLAADTIKVGVLHSLSGTMAISETTLKDTVLMMIEEQNKKGGLLGKQLEAV